MTRRAQRLSREDEQRIAEELAAALGEASTKDHQELCDSVVARDFVHNAYTSSGGATPDLKRVYGSYLDNERRMAEQEAAKPVEALESLLKKPVLTLPRKPK